MRNLLKNRVVKNFTALLNLQAVNYLLPLVTIPYLVRVLGPDKFGLFAFSQAFMQYFAFLPDYGFALTATREVSLNHENHESINKIVSVVFFTKLLLIALAFAAFFAVVFSFSKFRLETPLYFANFVFLIGSTFIPTWFFQGIEKMSELVKINIISKTLATIAIFSFVSKPADYILVAAIYAVFQIASMLFAWRVMTTGHNIALSFPCKCEITSTLRNGWHVFLSMSASGLYTVNNTFVLGIFAGNTAVGYYSAGEKIIQALQIYKTPFLQSAYPYACKLAKVSMQELTRFVSRVSKYGGIAAGLLGAGIVIFAKPLVLLVLGAGYRQTVPLVMIMALLPLLTVLSLTYANLFLLASGQTKLWSKIITGAALFNIIGVIILVAILDLKQTGVAINMVLTELFIFTFSYTTSKNRLMT